MAAGTLPVLIDQPPTWEPVPGGNDPAKVYATLKSEIHKPPEYQTGGARWDYRKVTITLYGRYDLVTQALTSVLAIFNAQTVLTLPSGPPNYFLRLEPLDAGNTKPTESQRQGQQIFADTCTFVIWTQRKN